MQKSRADERAKLIKLMQRAYSGELAAALAYNGHWKSLRDQGEIEAVKKIEAEELRHRNRLGEILREFGAAPDARREKVFFLIGKAIGIICFFCGRFCAAYFAGRLESENVKEYAEAANLAGEIERIDLERDFREMELTEFEHEQTLKAMIEKHWLLPFFAIFFRWGRN